MRPISKRVKQILEDDKRMEKCEVCGNSQVQWHHVAQFRGRQIDEAWAIAPACLKHHDQAHKEEIRELFEWNMLQRMTGEDMAKYPRDWKVLINYLSKKAIQYGWRK